MCITDGVGSGRASVVVAAVTLDASARGARG
jgi:hypothetical protein